MLIYNPKSLWAATQKLYVKRPSGNPTVFFKNFLCIWFLKKMQLIFTGTVAF